MRISLIILLATLSYASAGIWSSDDAIVIDALKSSKFKRDVYEETDAIVRTTECRTTRGQSGRCAPLRECYPMLYPIENNVTLPQGTLNDGLAEILVSIAGFCDVDLGRNTINGYKHFYEQTVKSEILICCRDQSNQKPMPLPPTSPGGVNGAGNDTGVDLGAETIEGRQGGGCGIVKINTTAIEKSDDRIVGGREATKGEFPWIVALMNKGRQFCGGSLIASEWVVTAAHCVQHMGASDVAGLRVFIGDHNIYSSADGKSESRTVTRVLYHKGFSMNHLHHDVALLKLASPVAYTTYIQPICIKAPVDNEQADVSGWGQLQDNGSQPQTLRTAAVKVWSHAACKSKYAGQAPAGIGEGMVCAGGSGQDSCRGDSGGPLTTASRTNPRLVGIVSWGIGCGSYPGVYTRASSYRDWITKNQKLRLHKQ